MKHSVKVRASYGEVNLEPAHTHESSTWLSALGLLLGKQQSSVPEKFLCSTSWKYRELQDNRGGKGLWSGSDYVAQDHVWLKFEGSKQGHPTASLGLHVHVWTSQRKISWQIFLSSSGCWHYPLSYASRRMGMFLTVQKEAAGKISSFLLLSALQLPPKRG